MVDWRLRFFLCLIKEQYRVVCSMGMHQLISMNCRIVMSEERTNLASPRDIRDLFIDGSTRCFNHPTSLPRPSHPSPPSSSSSSSVTATTTTTTTTLRRREVELQKEESDEGQKANDVACIGLKKRDHLLIFSSADPPLLLFRSLSLSLTHAQTQTYFESTFGILSIHLFVTKIIVSTVGVFRRALCKLGACHFVSLCSG